MRPLLVLLGSIFAACAPTADDDDDCAPSGIVDCATMNGQPDPEAEVLLRTGPEDEAPISTLADAQGCARFEPGAGDYEVQARNTDVNCISEWTPATAPACGDQVVTVEMIMGCLDGRGI